METETDRRSPLLSLDHASLQRNGTFILKDVNFEIPEGQHTAIIGPNGSGKSTLIKLISRYIYPLAHTDGRPSVTVFGNSVWNIFQLRNQLGIVSPELQTSFVNASGLTALDAVLSGFFATQGTSNRQVITPNMVAKSIQALMHMGAEELAEKRIEVMSAGEARRVLIARALVHEPRALLLDEPTTGLDIAGRRQFLETLRLLCARGVTLLLVTHHIDEVIPEIERIVLMQGGSLYADGPKEFVFTSDTLSKLFKIDIGLHQSADGYYSTNINS